MTMAPSPGELEGAEVVAASDGPPKMMPRSPPPLSVEVGVGAAVLGFTRPVSALWSDVLLL